MNKLTGLLAAVLMTGLFSSTLLNAKTEGAQLLLDSQVVAMHSVKDQKCRKIGGSRTGCGGNHR